MGRKKRKAKPSKGNHEQHPSPTPTAATAEATGETDCAEQRAAAPPRRNQQPRALALLAIATVCLLSYANGLEGDFVFDDTVAIVTNADVHSNASTDLRAIWNHDFWGKDIKSRMSHKSFRPLTTLTFRASFLMSGSTLQAGTFAFHAFNVLAHACVSGLLFCVLCADLGWGFDQSLAAALYFAAHPCHTEAVTGIVGRAELLSGGFMLASFSLYVRAISCRGGDRAGSSSLSVAGMLAFASACLAACGFLCKETAIVVYACNLLFHAHMVAVRGGGSEEKTKYDAIPATINTWALGCMLVFRAMHTRSEGKGISTAFTIAVGYRRTDNQIPFVEGSLDRLLTTLHSYVTYARVLVFPVWLSCDYSYNAVPSIDGIADVRNVHTLGVALCFLFCVWCWLSFPVCSRRV